MIDLRQWLPRATENDPTPSHHPKSGYTVHYEGVDVARDMSDAEAQLLIQANAIYHINKDWNDDFPGQQGGGGLMYAIVIAPSGTAYQTRDLDSVLWHAGNYIGNRDTVAVLVLAGPNTPPTKAQYRTLGEVLEGKIVYPHSYWSSTACPGDPLRYWLEYGDEEVEEMTKEERELEFLEFLSKHVSPTINAMKSAYDPIAAQYPKHDHKTYSPSPQV